MKKLRPVARVILIEADQIALLERHRQGQHYFAFPGGGIDPGETPEQAAIREALEETGLEVTLDQLVAEVTFRGSPQYFFLAHPCGGQMGSGTGPEYTEPPSAENGTYHPRWVALKEIPALPILPKSIAQLIPQHPNWPAHILYINED